MISPVLSAYHQTGFISIHSLLKNLPLTTFDITTEKKTLLMAACLRGDVPSIEAILQDDPTLDLNFSLNVSEIYRYFTSVNLNNAEAVLMKEISPLMAVIVSGNSTLIDYLVEKKAKVSYLTVDGDAVLMALVFSNGQIVKQILTHLQIENASLKKKEPVSSHLFLLIDATSSTKNIRELLKYSYFDFSITQEGKSLIQYANEKNRPEIAALIIEEMEKRKNDIFALIVFLSDGFLRFSEKAENQNPELIRFLKIAAALPLDLQMVLCNRVHRFTENIILTTQSEPAFKRLVLSLYPNKTPAVLPPAPTLFGSNAESPGVLSSVKYSRF